MSEATALCVAAAVKRGLYLDEKSNRVTMSDPVTDSSGLPAPKVTYEVSEDSRRNLDFMVERMTEAHQAAGAVETKVVDWKPAVSWHMLGTARCGDARPPPWSTATAAPTTSPTCSSSTAASSSPPPRSTPPPPPSPPSQPRAAEHLTETAHDQTVPL